MKNRRVLASTGGFVSAVVLLFCGVAFGVVAEGQQEPSRSTPAQPAVTEEQAVSAALKANPNSTDVEVELERDNGRLVYEVEFSDGKEILVDASDGSLVGTEHENEDEVEDESEDDDEDVDEQSEEEQQDNHEDGEEERETGGGNPIENEYNPIVHPANFVERIDNTYFPMKPA